MDELQTGGGIHTTLAAITPGHIGILLVLFAVFFGWGRIFMQAKPTTPPNPLPLDTPLTFWEGVWIFILYVLAAILGVIAGIVGGTLGAWLAIVAAILTIIATFWWLFGMVPPFTREWWDYIHDHPWPVFILLAIVFALLLIAFGLFLGFGGWILVALGVIGVLIAAAFVWGCRLVVWWKKKVMAFWSWVEQTKNEWIQWLEQQSVAIEQWEQRTIAVAELVKTTTCASWHWALKWICTGFVEVCEWVTKAITVFVKVVVWITQWVVRGAYVLVSIWILIVLFFTYLLPYVFWFCWFPWW